MKHASIIALALLGAFATAGAHAASGKVLEVTPVLAEGTTVHNHCWTEYQREVGREYVVGNGQRLATLGTRDVPVRHCEPVMWDGRGGVAYYSVVYEYRGERFVTHLPYDPGNWLPVQSWGEPIPYNYGRW